MAGRLTTHALDTVGGCGAAGLEVRLERLHPRSELVCTTRLNQEGRACLLEDGLSAGIYQLVFAVGAYHRQRGQTAVALTDPPFLDEVVVRFGIAAAETHYHVPILFSPYAYSTYRGS